MSHTRKTSQSNHSPRREACRRPATANVESTPLMTDALPEKNAQLRRHRCRSPGLQSIHHQAEVQDEEPESWKTVSDECTWHFGEEPLEMCGGENAFTTPRNSPKLQDGPEDLIAKVTRYLSSAVIFDGESYEEDECGEREGKYGTRGVYPEYRCRDYEKRNDLGGHKYGDKGEPAKFCEESQSISEVTPPAVGVETYNDYWDESVATDSQSEVGFTVQAHISYSLPRVRQIVSPWEVRPSLVKPVQLGEDDVTSLTPAAPPPSPSAAIREREYARRQGQSVTMPYAELDPKREEVGTENLSPPNIKPAHVVLQPLRKPKQRSRTFIEPQQQHPDAPRVIGRRPPAPGQEPTEEDRIDPWGTRMLHAYLTQYRRPDGWVFETESVSSSKKRKDLRFDAASKNYMKGTFERAESLARDLHDDFPGYDCDGETGEGDGEQKLKGGTQESVEVDGDLESEGRSLSGVFRKFEISSEVADNSITEGDTTADKSGDHVAKVDEDGDGMPEDREADGDNGD